MQNSNGPDDEVDDAAMVDLAVRLLVRHAFLVLLYLLHDVLRLPQPTAAAIHQAIDDVTESITQ